MRMKLMLAVVGCAFLWTSIAMAASQDMQDMKGMQGMQHEHAFRVGKKGEITLTQPTKVADRVLKPDTYVVQHRHSGSEHFVRFVELKKVSNSGRFTYPEQEKAGEIPCKLEPAGQVAKRTTVYTVNDEGGPRITKIAIKGEDAVHVF
jgi:hypothetical protein